MQNGLRAVKDPTSTPAPEFQSSEDYSFHRVVDNTRVSALRKYQAFAVGDWRLSTLIKYELLSGTVAFIPGALGIVLRQRLYKLLVRRLGKGVIIGHSVSLRHPGKISIGAQTVLDDYCVLHALGSDSSEITLGDRVFVGRNTVLKTRNGKITIHDYADIGSYCHIGTTERVEIGRHVLIAAYCYLGGTNHRLDDLDTPIALQGFSRKGGVVIEDDVWIGANAIISDGVRIAKGSVVGAGSVVTKDIPAYSVAYGVPAQVRRQRT